MSGWMRNLAVVAWWAWGAMRETATWVRWHALPRGSRRRHVAREAALRVGPLTVLIAVLLVVRGLLSRHEFMPGDRADAWILFVAAVCWMYVVADMVVRTRRWSVFALGVLSAILADVLLFGRASVAALWWEGEPVSVGFLNLIRACFLVGGPIAAVALTWMNVRDLRRWWRGRKGRNDDESSGVVLGLGGDGVDRRAVGVDGAPGDGAVRRRE